MPEKMRYKINVIPCNNTGSMSKHSLPKSKTAEDIPPQKETEITHKVESKLAMDDGFIQKLTKRSLEMIALRSKALTRRTQRFKSTLWSPQVTLT